MRARALLFLVLFAPIAGAQPKNAAPPETRPNTAAWERFTREHGKAWKVRWNPVSGTPHRVSGSALELPRPVNKNNVESVSRDFLAQHSELLGISVKQLVFGGATYEPPAKGGRSDGTWYVVFNQSHGGVPVPGGSVRLTIRHKSVTSFGADFFRDINVPATPVISEFQAAEIARRDMSASFEPITSRLTVFADARGETLRYFLAWELVMPVVRLPDYQRNEGAIVPMQWRYTIDALTGSILDRRNMMIHANVSGQVTGTIRSLHPADPPAIVPLPNLRVSVLQGAAAATADTDATGNYAFPGLSAGAATISAQIGGANVVVYNNETPNPDTTHIASVTAPATHDWNFAADDPSPGDVEESAYYHVDRIRQYFLRGAPFNITPTPVPMDVFVRDGPYGNASAGPSGLFFGDGGQDFALCADVVYHEYTHRIVDRVYTIAGVPLPYTGQSGAMNEGWADYFAATFTNDPSLGEFCMAPRELDTPNYRFPVDIVNEVHDDGRIFAGALWDLRSVLGATYVDALAMRAMKQAAVTFDEYLNAVLEEDDDPAFNPSSAADGNLANGTPNIVDICHAYYDLHGIWDAICLGNTLDPIALITDPPTPLAMIPPATTSIVITGTALGSTNGFQRFTLDYAHENAPATFLTAGITLAGGGLTTVNAGTLGVLTTTGLANGVYAIRLTVTDLSGRTGVATTFINFDRTVMAGWPQSPSVLFYGSPAVADLDPEKRGLEIAARGEDGMLRVWRSDGTSYPGFPIYSGGWFSSVAIAEIVPGNGHLEIVSTDEWVGRVSVHLFNGTLAPGWPQTCPGTFERVSPAVGDLDGDGKLEIVIGTQGGGVCAWHGDGTAVAGWPVITSGSVSTSVAIADLDMDGAAEVVAGSMGGNVYVWRGNGTLFPGWPVNLKAEVSASPAIGDMDGDGDLEIVVAAMIDVPWAWSSDVFVLHHTGVLLAGWPQSVSGRLVVPSSLVVADLDTDGSLDVAAQLADVSLHVWHADGTPMTGWPLPPSFFGYEFHPSSPAVADVDGNGIADLISERIGLFTGLTKTFQVYAHLPDASVSRKWTITYNGTPPVVADLDLDGRGELLVGAYGMFVWNLGRPLANGPREWPAYRHDAARTGAVDLGGQQNQIVIDINAGGLAIGGASQQKVAQTVTAGLVGHLTEVFLPVSCQPGSDLMLNIERVSSGAPSGTVLSSQIIPGSTLSFTGPVFRRFAIATPPLLFPTDEFAIVLSSTGTCSTYQGPVGDPYSQGDMHFDARPNAPGVWVCQCTFPGSAYDLPFKTFIGP